MLTQAPESSRVPELVGLQATQRLLQEVSCGGVVDQTHQVLSPIPPPALHVCVCKLMFHWKGEKALAHLCIRRALHDHRLTMRV